MQEKIQVSRLFHYDLGRGPEYVSHYLYYSKFVDLNKFFKICYIITLHQPVMVRSVCLGNSYRRVSLS